MSPNQPFVSILTPVYNTDKYLAPCIESILRQTYQNWEYVIVDNRSTDRSYEIAEQYAAKDSRIRIVRNKEHLALMPNLNHSMRQISINSEYCKVVHADDWLFPECIEKMVEAAEGDRSIGIVGAYRLDEDRVNLDGLPYTEGYISGKEVCRQFFLKNRYYFGSPTSILLRSEQIRNRDPFYNEKHIYADTEACFDILKSANFSFVNQVLTYSRRHNESETTVSKLFNTYLPAKLMLTKQFGPYYLTKEEYEKIFNRELKKYYRWLSRKLFSLWVLNRKDYRIDFFKYHESSLEEIGCPLRFKKLIKPLSIEIYNRMIGQLLIK
jgi:glycosyltransferase involved in cell wall biosynthesis